MQAGQLAHFGTGGSTGAFLRAAYGNTVFLRTDGEYTENGINYVKAYNTDDKNTWNVPVDEEVTNCVNFDCDFYKEGGGAFFLSA